MEKPANPARVLATRLAAVLHKHLAGRVKPAQIATELRSLASWIERGQPGPQEGKADDTKDQEVLELFQYWVAATDRNKSQTKLTPKRRTCITARLRDGYTVTDLKLAIDGCAASRFHQGENDGGTTYTDLTLIFRSGEHVEKFREASGGALPESDEKTEIQKRMKSALERGDDDAYTEAVSALHRLG